MMLERYMELALREAEKAFDKDEVPVGCVIVDSNGSVVGRGFNQVEMLKDATAHAEMIALTSAMSTMQSKYLSDCTLVVTLEPCPMCAGAIVLAKVGRVVFGSYDAKLGAAGTAVNLLENQKLTHRADVVGGIMEQRTTGLLKDFFAKKRAAQNGR
ncbi:MAG: tRNA adenosine deaminase [[Candidatus Thermochlorobacteriaceae] bacterium GBChlB]|jgi:tRNA(adenine34) deaminase|nr:MAG: tRNA adenosine deaminase [[Candidatus Thermochlorobacteriaceae] bacterium GBChlB]